MHIAHVLQRLHFFQFFNPFFFNKLHDLTAKKNTPPYRKKIQFFDNSQALPQKKITRIYRKKITQLDTFLYTTYIFHGRNPCRYITSGPCTTPRWVGWPAFFAGFRPLVVQVLVVADVSIG